MTEFEWETRTSRDEVAALLRRIADGLADDGEVELGQGEWELKLSVAEEVSLEVEVEIGDAKSEFEIELAWSTPGATGGEESDG